MDKASASGAGDCGFESHQGRILIPLLFIFFIVSKCSCFYFMPFLKFHALFNCYEERQVGMKDPYRPSAVLI